MKVLLDTNAYVRLLDGDTQVRDVLAKASTVFVSSVVLGELFVGFKGGTKERKNRDVLERFLASPSVRVVDVTTETAEVFAAVMDSLRKAGKPIPTNDVWIASHALEHGAAVVTFDKHFVAVPGVRLAFF